MILLLLAMFFQPTSKPKPVEVPMIQMADDPKFPGLTLYGCPAGYAIQRWTWETPKTSLDANGNLQPGTGPVLVKRWNHHASVTVKASLYHSEHCIDESLKKAGE